MLAWCDTVCRRSVQKKRLKWQGTKTELSNVVNTFEITCACNRSLSLTLGRKLYQFWFLSNRKDEFCFLFRVYLHQNNTIENETKRGNLLFHCRIWQVSFFTETFWSKFKRGSIVVMVSIIIVEDVNRCKGPFTLCNLWLWFVFAHNGLYRSWWCCHSRIVWTLPLSPVQPICCDKRNRSCNQKKNGQYEWALTLTNKFEPVFFRWLKITWNVIMEYLTYRRAKQVWHQRVILWINASLRG